MERASSKFFRPNRGFLWRTTWHKGQTWRHRPGRNFKPGYILRRL